MKSFFLLPLFRFSLTIAVALALYCFWIPATKNVSAQNAPATLSLVPADKAILPRGLIGSSRPAKATGKGGTSGTGPAITPPNPSSWINAIAERAPLSCKDASPSGTAITSSSSHFIDCAGNLWNMDAAGLPLLNGNATTLNSARALLFYNGHVYYTDIARNWFLWSTKNTGWIAMPEDPRANLAGVTGVISGICGNSNGQILTSNTNLSLCNSGTPSRISGSGAINWHCAGANGGSTAACHAFVTTLSCISQPGHLCLPGVNLREQR